jgi:hypothetical protein
MRNYTCSLPGLIEQARPSDYTQKRKIASTQDLVGLKGDRLYMLKASVLPVQRFANRRCSQVLNN